MSDRWKWAPLRDARGSMVKGPFGAEAVVRPCFVTLGTWTAIVRPSGGAGRAYNDGFATEADAQAWASARLVSCLRPVAEFVRSLEVLADD